MTIVKDLRILKRVGEKHGCVFDRTHRYCTDSGKIETTARRELQKDGYDLKYFDGCFYPFLVEVLNWKPS
jgi:hypothetical protein